MREHSELVEILKFQYPRSKAWDNFSKWRRKVSTPGSKQLEQRESLHLKCYDRGVQKIKSKMGATLTGNRLQHVRCLFHPRARKSFGFLAPTYRLQSWENTQLTWANMHCNHNLCKIKRIGYRIKTSIAQSIIHAVWLKLRVEAFNCEPAQIFLLMVTVCWEK